MIDLSPGHKGITQRYGVETIRVAMMRIITERFGSEVADSISEELTQVENRYRRAASVEKARLEILSRYHDAESHPTTRKDKIYWRMRTLLDNAEAYIEGSWKP